MGNLIDDWFCNRGDELIGSVSGEKNINKMPTRSIDVELKSSLHHSQVLRNVFLWSPISIE
jgi:hypothetical protein